MGTCFSGDNSAPSPELPYQPSGDNQHGSRETQPPVNAADVQLSLEFDGKGFHETYHLGNVIGEGAFSKVYSATVKRSGPNQGLQVAVKCIERNNLPKEDEEDLLEESIEGAGAALDLRREGAAAVSFFADMKEELPVIIRRTLERHTNKTNEAKRNGRYVSRVCYEHGVEQQEANKSNPTVEFQDTTSSTPDVEVVEDPLTMSVLLISTGVWHVLVLRGVPAV